MHYLVYQISNLLNGKTYIGCHKTSNKDDGYMGSGIALKRAVKKHGLENFVKDILFEASTSEEMFTKEKELVVLGPHSYNLKLGGEGGWDFNNNKRTKDEQSILSSLGGKLGGKVSGRNAYLLKRGLFNPIYKEKIKRCLRPDAFAGHSHTPEAKAKISAANSVTHQGAGNPNFGKHWIKNPITRESKMKDRMDVIPDGWFKGRIQNWS